MDTTTPDNLPARKPRSDIGRAHCPLTPERKARYIDGLKKSGSHRAAAMYATGDIGSAAADKQQFGYGYSTFLRERRIDPDFAAACDEALNEALGRLEESLMARAFLPDTRKQYDAKTGALIGESVGYEPCNRLARAILARTDETWVESAKRTIESNVTVTHNGGSAPGGVGFTITPRLTELLDDDQKKTLSDLMRTMVERQEKRELEQEQHKQLPPPPESETV